MCSDRLEVRSAGGLHDPAWDRFVLATPGGHYMQSTAWARSKAGAWTATRVTLDSGGDTVAGVQLLQRRVPVLGCVAYAPHGPLLPTADRDVTGLLWEALLTLCRTRRVRYLVVKPPCGQGLPLQELGFAVCARLSKVSATVRVDLSAGPETLLARMRRSTRANVRRGLRRGLTAREGGDEDLPRFLALLVDAARRKGYTTFPPSRYARMWAALRSCGHARLFLVEHEGELVSGQFAIPFGDTVYTHLMGWSGAFADRKPNELLEWSSMTWARGNGYRFYDFEGIDTAALAPRRDGGAVRTPTGDTWVSDYKLGFGGTVLPVPPTYERVLNPVFRWGYHAVMRADRPAVRRLEKRLTRLVSGARYRPAELAVPSGERQV